MTPAITVILDKTTNPQRPLAKLLVDNDLWAEIHSEAGEMSVHFYPKADGSAWRIPYVYLFAALEDAKRQLYYATVPA